MCVCVCNYVCACLYVCIYITHTSRKEERVGGGIESNLPQLAMKIRSRLLVAVKFNRAINAIKGLSEYQLVVQSSAPISKTAHCTSPMRTPQVPFWTHTQSHITTGTLQIGLSD